MKIALPDVNGQLSTYTLGGKAPDVEHPGDDACRVVLAAAHVVANPWSANEPSGPADIDWSATLSFRRHLAGLNLGIAEAMDTAQRGMGLDWLAALELIRQTKTELPDALIFNGCGTDHLDPSTARSLDDVIGAYLHQVNAVQALGGRVILMASRALVQVANSADDYHRAYERVLAECDQPVILHWLGDMFDPSLRGYWGSEDLYKATDNALSIIAANRNRIDGIKISLLDKEREISMRRLLPDGVKMYTGDDFNYPELIEGDQMGFSHALLGIFDPIATTAATAIVKLTAGDTAGYRELLNPTVPMAKHIFRSPTQHYKCGVVFLAWLNGFQDHFIMVNGAQSMRPLPYYVELFKLADGCGSLSNPELACQRMHQLLALHGVSQ
jgi:hypothetical protein